MLGFYQTEANKGILTQTVERGGSREFQGARTGVTADRAGVADLSLFYRKAPRFFNFLRQYGQWILIGLLITNTLSSALSAAVNGIFSAFSSAALFLVGLF